MILTNHNYIKEYNKRKYLEEKPDIDELFESDKQNLKKEVKGMFKELNKKESAVIRPRTTAPSLNEI